MDDAEDRQKLLGRVLQAFNDFSILRSADLQDALAGGDDELRVVLEPLSMEDLTRVWQSLQEPYLLSVSYSVQVVLPDP